MKRSVKSAIIIGAAAGLAASPFAQSAHANEATDRPDAGMPARITVSKIPEGEGRPVFADRVAFSQSGSVIGFSNVKPRRRSGVAYGSVPAAGSPATSRTAIAAPPGPRAMPAYFPLSARAMTSGFGPRAHPILGGTRSHSGVDLAARVGTPISATADGVVSFADWNGGYGIMVSVLHPGGVETIYGHMMRAAVSPGQKVQAGTLLGWVGTTGLSTGPHVHYEIRVDGRAVSPWKKP